MLHRPMRTAPASRSLLATAASLETEAPSKRCEPAAVVLSERRYVAGTPGYEPVLFVLSNVAILFLINIGMPWSDLYFESVVPKDGIGRVILLHTPAVYPVIAPHHGQQRRRAHQDSSPSLH